MLPDVGRQEDYDRVRLSWGCLGMHGVSANEFPEAVARVVRGYFAEGAFGASVKTSSPGTLQLSFFSPKVVGSPYRIEDRFSPVRIARTSDGFFFYGQADLYRHLTA